MTEKGIDKNITERDFAAITHRLVKAKKATKDQNTITISADDGGLDALQLLVLKEWFFKRFHRLLKTLREMPSTTKEGVEKYLHSFYGFIRDLKSYTCGYKVFNAGLDRMKERLEKERAKND